MKNKIRIIFLILFSIYSLYFFIGSTLAPIFAHFKFYDLSSKLTSFYIYSCHQQPDDKMTVSIVLSVLICPLFLLMKGDEAQVPAGTTKTAYTITDTYIKTVSL